MTTNSEFHEAANIFPLDEEHLDKLAQDIKQHGQLEPIRMLEGKILDGRRRFLACQKVGITPSTEEVSPDDPVAYVLSLNLHRRHLSETQRGMVGARIKTLYVEQAKERQATSTGGTTPQLVANLPQADKGKARDAAGRVVGVSGKTIDYAEKVLRNGVSELIEACDQDRVAVSTAARMTSLSEDAQRDFAKNAKVSKGHQRLRKNRQSAPEPEPEPGQSRGVGVERAHEAINILSRIPKNDLLRKRGFQIVADWLRANQ